MFHLRPSSHVTHYASEHEMQYIPIVVFMQFFFAQTSESLPKVIAHQFQCVFLFMCSQRY